MAGITDRAFRELCIAYGAAMVFTEMVSAKGLYYNDQKTAALLAVSSREQPVFAQIFGHEPDILKQVAGKAASFGAVGLDLNCGCPAPKIIHNQDGGAVLKTPGLVYDLVCAVREGCNVPVSVKIRKGWDDSLLTAVEAAKAAEAAGACMVTVHGRTVRQGYTGRADWNAIREVVRAVQIPVVGNGDIFDPRDAARMLEETGCAAVMIGRGMLGNPFLIRRTVQYLDSGELLPEPCAGERLAAAMEHIERIVAYKGENAGIREARKHALWYIKGMRGCVRVKNLITGAKTLEEMRGLLSALNDI